MDRILRLLQRLARTEGLSEAAERYISALERVIGGLGELPGDADTYVFHTLLEIIKELPKETRRSLLGMIATEDPEFYTMGLHGIQVDADYPARYEFIIRAGGEGNTREEAWEDATNALFQEHLGQPDFYYPIENLTDEDNEPDPQTDPFGDVVFLRLQYMEREEIVSHLTAAGIQCYPDESIEVLREALRVNIHDGTIVLPPPDD